MSPSAWSCADDESAEAVAGGVCGVSGVLARQRSLPSVLLISVDPELDGFAIDRCSAPDAAEPRRGALRISPRRPPRTVFEEWLGGSAADADRALLDQLASAVAVATLRIGPSVLRDDGVAADLLERVLAS